MSVRRRGALVVLAIATMPGMFVQMVQAEPVSLESSSGTESPVAAMPFAPPGPNGIALEYYEHRYAVSETIARTRLELQGRAGDISSDLKTALGSDYTDAWFDNTDGQWVFAVTEDASSSEIAEVASTDHLEPSDYRVETLPYNADELAEATRQFHIATGTQEAAGEIVSGVGAGKIEAEASSTATDVAQEAIKSAKSALTAAKIPVVERVVSGSLIGTLDSIKCTWPYCNEWIGGPRWYVESHSGLSCSVGFYVTWPGSNPWWLTAGHCITAVPRQTPVCTDQPGSSTCEDMAYTEVGYSGASYPGSGIADAGLLTNAIKG